MIWQTSTNEYLWNGARRTVHFYLSLLKLVSDFLFHFFFILQSVIILAQLYHILMQLENEYCGNISQKKDFLTIFFFNHCTIVRRLVGDCSAIAQQLGGHHLAPGCQAVADQKIFSTDEKHTEIDCWLITKQWPPNRCPVAITLQPIRGYRGITCYI